MLLQGSDHPGRLCRLLQIGYHHSAVQVHIREAVTGFEYQSTELAALH